MQNRTVYTMLQQIENQENDEKRIAKMHVLSQAGFKELKTIFDYAFNPYIKFLLPEGEPPVWRASSEPGINMIDALKQRIRVMRVFVEGVPEYSKMKQKAREDRFISFLGEIHPDDAKVVIAVKDKKLPDEFPHVTKELVSKAFPILAQTWGVEEKKSVAKVDNKPVKKISKKTEINSIPLENSVDTTYTNVLDNVPDDLMERFRQEAMKNFKPKL